MSDQGGFERIDQEKARLYGPRCLLASGLDLTEQEHLLGLADGLENLPVVFATEAEQDRTLGQLLELPNEHNRGSESGLARAIVMAGLRGDELHMLMTAWRKLGHSHPLWATLTPTSESWPLGKLLAELAAEHEQMSGGSA